MPRTVRPGRRALELAPHAIHHLTAMPDQKFPTAPPPLSSASDLTPLRCARPHSVETIGNFKRVLDSKGDEPARDYTISVDARQTNGETLRFVVFAPILMESGATFVDRDLIRPIVAETSTYQVTVYDKWRGLKVVLVASRNVLDLGGENFNVTLNNAAGREHVAKAASHCLADALEWPK